MPEVVLTSDWTMMSNHHGKEFLGFGTTTPALVLPEAAYRRLFYPPMACDDEGHPVQAPYGLRKIEAALLDAGIDARIIHPSYLHHYMPGEAKLLLLSGHDYLGLNPPSTTFSGVMGKPPLNRINFMRMMRQPHVLAAHRQGMRIIAGGPSAWQFTEATRSKLEWVNAFLQEIGGIDTVVEGEAEVFVVDIVRKALGGEPLPAHVVIPPKEAPTVDQIPTIRYASINGLTEIGRGCCRGCSFCSVTQRPTRWYPLEKIEQEILVNVRSGQRSGLLHSDDVMFYGSPNIMPREEKLLPLMAMAKKHYEHVGWSHVAVATLMTKPNLLPKIHDILCTGKQTWWGAEIGVETGSPRLITKAMPGKVAPFRASQWPELVVQAAGLLNDNSVYPACTFIVGLPQETEEDVIKTIDLFDDLWDFKAILVPMFFVPLGHLKERDWFRSAAVTDRQRELFELALTHGLHQSRALLEPFLEDRDGLTHAVYRTLFTGFIDFVHFIAEEKGLLREPGSAREHHAMKSPLQNPDGMPLPTIPIR
jgi:radical SAM superfamily enzyme YgiQ (UPF0313 family)